AAAGGALCQVCGAAVCQALRPLWTRSPPLARLRLQRPHFGLPRPPARLSQPPRATPDLVPSSSPGVRPTGPPPAMVPSQEEPVAAATQGTSEAQPPGPAPSEDAPLPGPGPSDGPDVSSEKVEVELTRSTGDEPPVPPEGGWGWLVMLAAMWCNGSVFGIQNAYGVLFVSMQDTFGAKDSDNMAFKTAWVGSLSMGMIFFCCPIVSVFTDMFGCRKTAVVGAAVGFIGLMSSSFVSSIEPLYLTYGIIFACGCSFAYQPSLVILGHYFKKRLGLVNGIVTAGSSVFTILLPLLLGNLTNSVGLFYTLRILCIFMFVLFLAGFTYRPLVPSTKEKESEGRKFSPPKKFFNFAIFKVTAYAVWAVGIPLALFGYFVPYVHLMNHVKERFQDEKNKEVLFMCIGITSGVGRLLFGRIADYVPGLKKVYLQVLSFFFIGLMSMMIPLCSVFGALIAVCLIMGLFDGCFISIMAPIAFELVGPQDASQAIGFLLGFMSIPMTVGPPVAGLLHDKLGSYNVAFYLAGIPPFVGGLVLCLIPWIHSKKQREISRSPGGEKMEKMETQNSLLSSSSRIFKKQPDSII
ncbi:Monocarboxylate transporter 10, partial [Lemmus lemmus]